ncbi:hypothetical protein [Amycolatopsis panacis]|uniref:Uncharacterized protein n=1 Tax=Amycolatopsis panacis TaxID=2340917 RepID=A0A419I3L1_9PSEU|nr:hypothetical protein [Amycolatopsis panacis]RJQ84777.1 hypothetical protein D5S19_16050 [Amycolatopsis panacis]
MSHTRRFATAAAFAVAGLFSSPALAIADTPTPSAYDVTQDNKAINIDVIGDIRITNADGVPIDLRTVPSLKISLENVPYVPPGAED